jgi:hypothetical protein
MSDGLVGKVRIRSNVVLEEVNVRKDHWALVPGEIVERYRRGHFSDKPSLRQKDEKMYYEPCSVCRRTIDIINLEGCDQCSHAPSAEAARANRERHDAVLQRVYDERALVQRALPYEPHAPRSGVA